MFSNRHMLCVGVRTIAWNVKHVIWWWDNRNMFVFWDNILKIMTNNKDVIYRGNIFSKTVNMRYGPQTDNYSELHVIHYNAIQVLVVALTVLVLYPIVLVAYNTLTYLVLYPIVCTCCIQYINLLSPLSNNVCSCCIQYINLLRPLSNRVYWLYTIH